MRTEYDLQKDIIAYLNKKKVWHFRTQMGNTSGYPDIIACVQGFFVGFELKREDGTGKPTPQQLKMSEDIRKAGGFNFFIKSLDELKEALETLNALVIIVETEDIYGI